MTAVSVFALLALLLVVGKNLRIFCPVFQRLYLPSSVVGGLVGLAVLSVLKSFAPGAWQGAIADWSKCAAACPGFLISVIFATLFLGARTPKVGEVLGCAFPQLCLGQIIAWGQYVVGLGLAGFVFAKCFGVPAAFGNLLEIGFEGGHGTAGGMAEAFVHYGWKDGVALGFTVATIGMILGIVIGMVLIQWAYGNGHVKEVVGFSERRFHERIGIHLRAARPGAGSQTTCCDSIDSLAWHLAIVGVSVLIGWGLWSLIPMKGFPLFPLCMVGGILLQSAARLVGKDLLVDRVQMERISGASLDFLVVSAVATIRLDIVAANWLPLVILCASGVIWTVSCVIFIAPRIFRDAWFERAIAEFGQATGVTATGLMLLRTVDPENRTPAAMSFGYKQLLHEPIMGGGVWTALALALVYEYGWQPVFWFSFAMLALWGAVGFALAVNRRKGGRP